MKTVYMVFNDKEKISVSSSLYDNLKYVFQEYIKVKTCFLDEIDKLDIIDGDLFIVLYKDRVYAMREYVSSLDKVIVLSRTIQKKYLPDILNIQEGTDVLVVNDSSESTLQTANTLYELGINHINLVPYEEGPNAEERYRNVQFAITPNEVMMVPKNIKNIINIEDRYIDLNTFVSIINKLSLNNERITRNLIKYTDLLAGTDMGINQKYIADHLKSEMLKNVIHNTYEAILLTDNDYKVVYANDKAEVLFDIKGEQDYSDVQSFFKGSSLELEYKENLTNKLFNKNGTNYIVTKNAVMILDQVVGHSITLSNEQDIKNMDNDLTKQLVNTGMVAKYSFENIICKSENMKKCLAIAKKAALTDYTVLISGESGTGKELVAQSIHRYSNRKNNAFVAINCAALPESLLESELFGYEKGAFTGALVNGKVGLFERANKGTIFLDEIGDMSLNLQARLLRVLQEKQIMRLGSDKIIDVDIRIIAATNRKLLEEVKNKNFREDLYYRLCNIPVKLPPLRERREDVLPIVYKFLGADYDRLSDDEKTALIKYDWPGNVRELENTANYFKTLGELPTILPEQSVTPSAKSMISSVHESRAALNKGQATEIEVLSIIDDNTEGNLGIGRSSILYELKQRGIFLSDGKARTLLSKLEEQGWIEVGKGRIGCRIKEAGRKALEER